MGAGGVWELSVLSTQFCYAPKSALKMKLIKYKQINKSGLCGELSICAAGGETLSNVSSGVNRHESFPISLRQINSMAAVHHEEVFELEVGGIQV